MIVISQEEIEAEYNDNKEGKYSIQSKNFTSVDDVVGYYKKLTSNYPIKSIEDPFAEEDWESWKKITNEIGKNVQIVGDDLFVTNETVSYTHLTLPTNREV